MVTIEQLAEIAPALESGRAELYYPDLTAGMARFEITTPLREAAYLATLLEESAGLTRFVENLNYSARRLMQVWPRRFPTLARTVPYARRPQPLANYVYADRLGNGPAQSGDGWRFRGRGPIMATGRDMYERAGPAVGEDLIADPDRLLLPEVGFAVSAWIFAVEKNCNPPADRADMHEITRRINGAQIGIEHRLAYFARARKVLAA